MTQDPSYRFPSMIICEGPEDVILFQTIANHMHKQNLHILHTGKNRRSAGGNTMFEGKLKSLRAATGFQKVAHLLIVTDSDDDPDSSFTAVREQIKRAGFPAPQRPFERCGTNPSVTVGMIPPEGVEGDLETICGVAARSAHATAAGKVDAAMATLEGPKWSASRKRKAWLRVFLASIHNDPFVPLGTSIQDQGGRALIPIDHAVFGPLRDAVASLP
jgi:hypothetical protein